MEDINKNLDRIKTPGGGAKVYKDECFYSFDCPESTTGLYVCLNRWLGVGERFLTKYSNRTDNKVFLYIKKTLKEKNEQEVVPEKVSRLAINMEGGFQTDNPDEWEEELKVVVLPGREQFETTDPALPMAVQLAVAGIRVATSATKLNILDSASGTWDGEALVVSKHAENLKQVENPPRIPPSGWKCAICDLTTNLWLNLTDGSIMCGRKFFDGSGGNNHGVDHYKGGTGGGPLAVKLGTITWEGKADVFSYEEDDMVLDPYLEKHLQHFGIKLSSCEKTDKTMNEINIDMNNRIGEYGRCEERGQKLVSVWGPGRTGLHNLGNTCYMNSVLQVLFTIPELRECYSRPDWLDRGNLGDPAGDLTLQLAKLCQGLTSGLYSLPKGETGDDGESQPGVKPVMFKHLVGKGHAEFSSNRQQDAQEFLLHLLNLMEKAHQKTPTCPTPISSLQFLCEDRFVCRASGQVRYKQRVEDYLPLPIPLEAATNVEEVTQYLLRKAEAEAKGERLIGEDMVRAKIPIEKILEDFVAEGEVEDFFSSAIQGKTTAGKTVRLASFPEFLLVQMLKFQTDQNWQPIKLDCEVDMPDQLDLSNLRGSGLQAGEVELPEDKSNQQEEVVIDDAVVSQLVDMGFGREACRRAVFSTGNTGVEPAMSWVMQHMEDPDFNSPFQLPGGSSSAKKCTASEETIGMVMSMGFSKEQAEMALRNTDNNMERAIEWIFSHPDGEEPEKAGAVNNDSNVKDGVARYTLSAFITHMGSSSHSGHYVCHIKDPEDSTKWIIFNDNRVQLSVTPPKELGYLYLYKREG